MDEEKSSTKAEQPCKIVGQLLPAIIEAINPETIKFVDQGVAVNVLKNTVTREVVASSRCISRQEICNHRDHLNN